jgi:hypothetical protein
VIINNRCSLFLPFADIFAFWGCSRRLSLSEFRWLFHTFCDDWFTAIFAIRNDADACFY